MEGIRVLIADDHTLVREGLRALLEGQGGFDVIAEASNGREAVDRAIQMRPDVVLMDIGMPELDGLAATRRITKVNPAIRVLVLTVHETEDYFFRVLEAGAHGFLVKDAASTELVAAVRAVHHGGVYLHPPMAKRLVEEYLQRIGSGEERAAHAMLTPRERQILALIGAGHTNQEIAEQLSLSVNTVQAHRSHIIDKLNLHSRADLMRYAVRVGLLREPR
ncbi:MAG: two-component response regulator, two-component system, NarL family, response regulator NreC [Chloroflexi bacterium CSP1-4]|nr:MAG: two-component response regulator, two-component system, NarL family, response regulator NreC [Chloroflexi bacterium CSP1-4]